MVAVPAAQAIEIFGMRFFEGDVQDRVTLDVPDPVTYEPELQLTGEENKQLKKTLEEASNLVSEVETPVSGQAGLISRARNDRERLIATLYTEGRYGGTVEITLDGKPLDAAIEDFQYGPRDLSRVVPVEIVVDPGPQFTFGELDLDVAELTPGVPATLETFGVRPGEVAQSGLILSAEQQIVAAYREQGHPLARVVDRQIVADHPTNTLDVAITVDPGPVATFGAVQISGLDRAKPGFVEMMAEVPTGQRYSASEMKKIEERLRELGIFGTLVVREGDAVDENGRIPVEIEVTERKRRVIGAGVTATSSEGLGLEAYWRHRNLFGGAETLGVSGSIGRLIANAPDDYDYNLAVAFGKPGIFGPATHFSTSLEFEHENPESFSTTSLVYEAGVEKEFTEKFSAFIGVESELSRTRDAFGINEYWLLGAPLTLNYDSRDNERDPTRGFIARWDTEPMTDVANNAFFWINEGSLAVFQKVDPGGRLILAGRVGAGSIFGAGLTDIPATRRFYLGGGGSVRGYAYENISPRNAAGQAIGGRSYVEGQFEARIKVTEKIGFVPFVDVGAAFTSQIPDFSEPLSVGAGVGLRYFTPIGPLRFDVAVPFSPKNGDPDIAFYVGLSQAF